MYSLYYIGFVLFTASSAGINLAASDCQYISHFTPMWTPNLAAKLNEMDASKIGNHILCVAN